MAVSRSPFRQVAKNSRIARALVTDWIFFRSGKGLPFICPSFRATLSDYVLIFQHHYILIFEKIKAFFVIIFYFYISNFRTNLQRHPLPQPINVTFPVYLGSGFKMIHEGGDGRKKLLHFLTDFILK